MRPLKREPSSLTVMQTSSAAREAASPTISPSGRRNNKILPRHQNRGRSLSRSSRARTAIRPSTAGPRKELRAGDHQDEKAFTKPRCDRSCGVKGWCGDHPSARRGRRRQLKIISSYQKIQPSNQQHIHEHSSNAANIIKCLCNQLATILPTLRGIHCMPPPNNKHHSNKKERRIICGQK